MGVKLFPGGGGGGGGPNANSGNPKNCDFPGGGADPLSHPSGSAHVAIKLLVIDWRDFTDSYTVLVRKWICRLGQAQSPEPKIIYTC